uniref:5'-nucleotidase domain-containing protein 3 n=1 Tax=Ditylenchus dipsaci TaxID=166011 RepID=A0A915DF36_9BILA
MLKCGLRSVPLIRFNRCSSCFTSVAAQLRTNYDKAKEGKLNVFGFDYDYTLAVYTKSLYELIYDLALARIPRLVTVTYNIDFAIRGLHYDIENCCLLKVDAFNQIQKGTVFRGKKKLTDEQICDLYGGYSLPDNKDKKLLTQLIDLFSLPWAGLLATTVEYFDENSIEFDPVSLHEDVATSIQKVHSSGDMYSLVIADLEKYIHKNVGLAEYLTRLQQSGKELFMITNSPFTFMNKGMTYIFRQKPTFFQSNRPFRLYNETTDTLSYEKITQLESDKIYAGGNIAEFAQKATFRKPGVLYFGDHIYSDLADPKREIRIQDHEYWRKVRWLETLTHLIENHQKYADVDADTLNIIRQWAAERKVIREQIKALFNPNFGSMFRTFHDMSFFCRRLSRLSDIYTSRLPNLFAYTDEHTFFPKRTSLPHEINISINVPDMPLCSSKAKIQILLTPIV